MLSGLLELEARLFIPSLQVRGLLLLRVQSEISVAGVTNFLQEPYTAHIIRRAIGGVKRVTAR